MKDRHQGFTLIEVLIAAVVLSIGLLGLAALQAKGLRSNHSSNLRSQATLMAYDMADRMRANLNGYEGGFYDNTTAADHDCVWKGSQPATCTPQQMAAHDVWEWNASLARELPQGVGVVCLDSTPGDGSDTDADGVVEPAEFGCDGLGTSYVVKLWSVDELAIDDQTGNPVTVIRRVITEVRP
ncbi:MAG: type IV pilus modification protein PilV [Thiohalocapsa sp.]